MTDASDRESAGHDGPRDLDALAAALYQRLTHHGIVSFGDDETVVRVIRSRLGASEELRDDAIEMSLAWEPVVDHGDGRPVTISASQHRALDLENSLSAAFDLGQVAVAAAPSKAAMPGWLFRALSRTGLTHSRPYARTARRRS